MDRLKRVVKVEATTTALLNIRGIFAKCGEMYDLTYNLLLMLNLTLHQLLAALISTLVRLAFAKVLNFLSNSRTNRARSVQSISKLISRVFVFVVYPTILGLLNSIKV